MRALRTLLVDPNTLMAHLSTCLELLIQHRIWHCEQTAVWQQCGSHGRLHKRIHICHCWEKKKNAQPKAERVELEKLYDNEEWQRSTAPPPRKELESTWDSGGIARACSKTLEAEEVFPKIEYLPDIQDTAPPQAQQKPWPNQTDCDCGQIPPQPSHSPPQLRTS